jgi:hypothetical protein
MKRLAPLLVLLLISAQVDDFYPATTISGSVPVAEDDNEYLPGRRPVLEEQVISGLGPMLVGLKPKTPSFSVVRRGAPSDWKLTTPFTPLPLHFFTSLQI